MAAAIDGLFVAGDLSTRSGCRALVDAALASFGRMDILVNNAGFQHIDAIDAFPEDTWDTMIALMLTAPFLLTKYAWPSMQANGWGRVIKIGSPRHALFQIRP